MTLCSKRRQWRRQRGGAVLMRVYNSHGLSLCLPPIQVAFTHVFYFAAVYFIGKYVCMYVCIL